MAVKNKNPLLGHWTCSEGGRAEVYQTTKPGRHFYTRCDCCGLNQGTGAGRQNKIYRNAEFIDGATVIKPSNVTDEQAKVGELVEPTPAAPEPEQPTQESEPVSESVTDNQADFDPTDEPDEVEENEEPEPKRGKGALVAGCLLLVSAAAGFLAHGK